MIFSFWRTDAPPFDHGFPAAAAAAWRAAGARFQVFDTADVQAALAPWGAEAQALFSTLRLPACQADLARLVLMHRHGGLYVDAHAGPGHGPSLARLLAAQADHELLLWDESPPRPGWRNTCILNGVIGGARGSGVLALLIGQALDNLRAHRTAERRAWPGHAAYNVYQLTGPWMIWHALYERPGAEADAELQVAFRERVAVWPFEPDPARRAVHWSRFTDYKRAGRHWSERQACEPLFEPDGQAADDARAAVAPNGPRERPG